MGTLASQAETDIWVRLCDEPGYKLRANLEIVCAKSCNLVHFGRKMVRNAAHNAFLIILTIGTQFLCVHPRRGPCFPTSFFPGESPPYRRTNSQSDAHPTSATGPSVQLDLKTWNTLPTDLGLAVQQFLAVAEDFFIW